MTPEHFIPLIVTGTLLTLVMRTKLHTAIKVLLGIIIFILGLIFRLSLMK